MEERKIKIKFHNNSVCKIEKTSVNCSEDKDKIRVVFINSTFFLFLFIQNFKPNGKIKKKNKDHLSLFIS